MDDKLRAGLAGSTMEAAQAEWFRVFYNDPPWYVAGKTHLCRFADIVSAQVATLCAAESTVRTGSGARAAFLQEQVDAFVAYTHR